MTACCDTDVPLPPPHRQEQPMTMTRQQLEDVISRQLDAVVTRAPGSYAAAHDASRRAILAAVDDWTASQAAAAVTPPAAEIIPLAPKATFPGRLIARLARALDTTTGGTR